ncbi:MAG: ROK family protein [Armatimonadota bacterium]|nr:ROK family protein [Armatimonadota bacterium]
MELVKPRVVPPLDESFRPAVLANRAFREKVKASGQGVPMVIGVERADGTRSVYHTEVFAPGSADFEQNLQYVERILKFLLWQKGGYKVYLGGPPQIGEYIQKLYSPQGERAFDHEFMGETVYERPFEVVITDAERVPPAHETAKSLGRHLDGCRIGLDLGASDRKVSAVIEGKDVFSEEVVWDPRPQTDPNYHYHEIMSALHRAAAHMPRVDAIGVSSAGVWINNRVMVASLFRGVPRDVFNARAKDIFLRVQKEWGVPLEVANDGEVTALAGSMSLGVNAILGVAMGSSEAAGYVTPEGNITNWLNELAFAPVDYAPDAPVDEWSGDRGVGALYFSQQAVFRLAPVAGISLDESLGMAERLKSFQELHASGDPRTRAVYETIGVYLGYGIAHYADFYDLQHVLVLGRVTSGEGGHIIIDKAHEVLRTEFPELAARISVNLPDEKARRVGQSIAAASLPEIPKERKEG